MTRGSISILVLVLGVVFTIAVGGLVTFGATSYDFGRRQESLSKALLAAEAGIQYYRWHLAHAPDDFTDGTGQPGPYIHDYYDPQGGVIGQYSLEIEPPVDGSSTVTITSTGWDNDYPSIRRTVQARYGAPSLAQYAFLHNANVWFGSGITIYGRVLSNGGIRQDGVNTSTVQSAKETYTCGSETGCDPAGETKPGVWGAGGPQELWEFPVPAVDFDSIGVDFNLMKTAAETEGVYLGPSGDQGYHLVFKDDGTVDVYQVTNTQFRRGYSVENGCEKLYQRILQETFLANYSLAEKQVYFAEDTVWVEGVVNGKATVAAARFPLETYETNIWIPNSIIYLAKDGNHKLGIIAQNDIYFGLDIPTVFEINAAILAQTGKVIRHHYKLTWCGNYGSSAVKDKLVIQGSLISNQKSYWNFGSAPTSGFVTREVTYDNDLYLEPPPYFPTSGEYEFISWDEVNNP